MGTKYALAVDGVLALSAVVITTVVVLNFVGLGPSASSTRAEPPTYKPGDSFEVPVEMSFDTADKTIVLVLRSTCVFCTESMPFYRTLIAAAKSGGVTQAIVLGSEDEQTTRTYVSQHALEVDRVASVPSTSLKVSGTPTVVLVDRKGKVQNVWVGRPSSSDQRKMLEAVR